MNLFNLLFAGGAAAALVLDAQTETSKAGWNFFGDFVTGKDVIRLGKGQNSHATIGATSPVDFDEWTIDTMLYAISDDPNGDPGSSGFALWYTTAPLGEGPIHGGQDFWDGLAIMLDSLNAENNKYNPQEPGSVRGHFNDGSKQFAGIKAPSRDAFSLCEIHYRQARGPQRLRVGYGRGVFVVEVNDQKCFQSDAIQLPRGYVGISADTSISKDTFAVGRLEVREGLDDDLAKYFPEGRIDPKNAAAAAKPAVADTPKAADAAAPAAPRGAADPAAPAAAAEQYNALTATLQKLSDRFDAIEGLVVAQSALGSAGKTDMETTEKLLGASVSQVGDRVAEKVKVLIDRADRTDRLIQQLQTSIDNLRSDNVAGDVRVIRQELSSLHQRHAEAAGAVPTGPSVYQIIGVSALVQIVVYVVFAVLRRRRNLHQKIL